MGISSKQHIGTNSPKMAFQKWLGQGTFWEKFPKSEKIKSRIFLQCFLRHPFCLFMPLPQDSPSRLPQDFLRFWKLLKIPQIWTSFS